MLRIVENPPSLIVWFRVKISAGRSSAGNADYAHHPPDQMLQNVAMEHPVTRIVGNEGDFDFSRGAIFTFSFCPRLAKYPSWYYRY
jgi:hypothetical protein